MSEQFAPGEVLFDVIELIDQPRVQAYARAAKDDNAIHVDTEAAQAVGLEGPVAHGMLSVGIALGHVMEWLAPDVNRFLRYETRFTKPVFVHPDASALLRISGTLGAVSADELRIDVKVQLEQSQTVVLRPFRVFVRPKLT
jgi:acyl dehydratase